MADGLLGAYFGNPNIQRQGARARALAKQRDVNLLADPKTYAVVQGLLGTPPDQLGFSVLNPKYQEIKQVAEPAFYAGSLLQVAPATAPAVNRIAQAVGPKLEQTLLPAFEAAYNRGGLTREMVEAMGTNTASKMFIGASSPMFDKKMAFEASKLAKKGKTPQEIWEATGTVKGPDGQWRQEISDTGSAIIEGKLPTNYIEGYGDVPAWKLEQSLKHPELYASYPNLKDVQGSFRGGGAADATYNSGMDWISYNKEKYQKGFIPKEIEEKLALAKKARDDFYQSDEVVKYDKKLNDVLDETNDFSSIDGLLDPKIEAKREKLNNDYYGLLRQTLANTDEGVTLGSGQSAKKTTLHEIQHAIQEREGFAVGGSPEQFKDQAKAIEARDVLGWTKELRRKAQEMPGADSIAIDAALRKEYETLGAQDWIPSAEVRQKALQPSLLYPEKYDGKEAQQMQQLVELYGLDKRTEPLSDYDVYKNLMGEAEARLTERRMDLTPEQRKKYFPFEYTGKEGYGLDVNPEDLLYFNEKGQFIQRGLLD